MTALALPMFLKEQGDKSVKARMRANGRKQRGDWTKQDTTSPTMLTEAVLITTVIEAREERYVACFDILGAFLHAKLDEDINMIQHRGEIGQSRTQHCPPCQQKQC